MHFVPLLLLLNLLPLFWCKIKKMEKINNQTTNSLYTHKSLVVLLDCLLEAVRTNPGYGMATLIYNFWDYFSSLQGNSAEFLYIQDHI